MNFGKLRVRYGVTTMLLVISLFAIVVQRTVHFYETRGIQWQPFSAQLMVDAAKNNQTTIVVFTGDWDSIYDSKTFGALESREVKHWIRANDVVCLHAHCALATNKQLLASATGSFDKPSILIWSPNPIEKPMVLPVMDVTSTKVMQALRTTK